jgi:hypothetical protein
MIAESQGIKSPRTVQLENNRRKARNKILPEDGGQGCTETRRHVVVMSISSLNYDVETS